MIRIYILMCACLWCAAAEPTPLRIGFNPWIGFSAAFVAQEADLFAKHGIKVELVSFQGPADSVAPVIAGHLDATLTTVDTVVAANHKAIPSLLIPWMVDASNGADGIVGRMGVVSRLAELKGKRVAAAEGQINHLMLLLALQKAGLKQTDIQFVNMGADDAGAALIAGQIDAAATWEPWLSQVVEKKAGSVLATSAEFPGLLADCLAVTPARLSEKLEPLKAFIAALEEARMLIATDPAKTSPMIAKCLGIKATEVEPMLAGALLYDAAANRKLVGDKAYAETLDRIAAFLVEHGAIGQFHSTAACFDARLVP